MIGIFANKHAMIVFILPRTRSVHGTRRCTRTDHRPPPRYEPDTYCRGRDSPEGCWTVLGAGCFLFPGLSQTVPTINRDCGEVITRTCGPSLSHSFIERH